MEAKAPEAVVDAMIGATHCAGSSFGAAPPVEEGVDNKECGDIAITISRTETITLSSTAETEMDTTPASFFHETRRALRC